MNIDLFISRLEKVRRVSNRSNQWFACCPCHDDHHPSLCITQMPDKILMHCFACQATGRDVSRNLGIPEKELF